MEKNAQLSLVTRKTKPGHVHNTSDLRSGVTTRTETQTDVAIQSTNQQASLAGPSDGYASQSLCADITSESVSSCAPQPPGTDFKDGTVFEMQ